MQFYGINEPNKDSRKYQFTSLDYLKTVSITWVVAVIGTISGYVLMNYEDRFLVLVDLTIVSFIRYN